MAIVWWTTSSPPTRWTQAPNATVVAASTVLAGGFIASLAAIENAQQPVLPLPAPGWHQGWSTYSSAKGDCVAPAIDTRSKKPQEGGVEEQDGESFTHAETRTLPALSTAAA